jgi:hypothetical protein
MTTTADTAIEHILSADAARLAQKLRFLADDVAAYVTDLKRRELYHAMGDKVKALEQSAGVAASVLRETDPGAPLLAQLADWKASYHDVSNAAALLLRTVDDALCHGLNDTTRANVDAAVAQLRPLLPREIK